MQSEAPVSVHARLRQRLWLALVLALLIAAAPAVVVLASHQFSDVPNSHLFHNDISEFAGAGITSGCGGTKFCPDDGVTRGQMAAFMNRGLPRTSLSAGGVTFEDADAFYVVATALRTGGASGGTGYVVVEGDITAYTEDADTCPCEVGIQIDMLSGSTVVDSSNAIFFDVANTPSPSGFRNGAGSVSWVFEVPTRTNRTFALGSFVTISGGAFGADGTEAIEGSLTATYLPFGEIAVPAFTSSEGVRRSLGDRGALRLPGL